MTKSILSVVIPGILAAVAWAEVQIPPGFEIVRITNDPAFDWAPRMNNCGEVVFSKGVQGDAWAEVFLYDNGKVTQITDDNNSDTFPNINDEGTIVWTRHADGFGGGEVVRLRYGVLTVLGEGSSPRINNLGHVVWARWWGDGCWYARTDIMFYDGATVEQLTVDDPYNEQGLSINDHDQIVWKWVDVCVGPWESEIILWVDGATTQLTTDQIEPGSPSINNRGQVVWAPLEGVELWEDGVTTLLTDWGGGPMINNRGEILFYRWDDGDQASHLWLYRNEGFHQLTDGLFSASRRNINDDGEALWLVTQDGQKDVWMMRRVRNGDINVDWDVDAEDFAPFPGCATGPLETDRLCACRFFDLDHDRDVDLGDFAMYQNLFTGEK